MPIDTPPGELLARSVGFLLSKLGFCASSGFTAVLAPLGIQPQHFGVLRFVDAMEGQSQQAMAEALQMPPSRIVAFVDDLEERKLVERRRNPSDRRAHALYLTAEGRAMFERAMEVAIEFENDLCANLTRAEREQLLDLLRRLAASQGMALGIHPTHLAERGSGPE